MNNMLVIHGLLKFDDPDLFYFVQILKRKADHPHLSSNGKLIKNFYIKSYKDLNDKMPIFSALCDKEKARAYIRLNRRSSKQCALFMLAEIARRVSLGDYNVENIYLSTLGKHHAEKDKTWLVDIDDEQVDAMDEIITLIKNLHKAKETQSMLLKVPTKKGVHLICSPFNLLEFKTLFRDVEVHKDNPTLLYW